jgi:hypothetical protein
VGKDGRVVGRRRGAVVAVGRDGRVVGRRRGAVVAVGRDGRVVEGAGARLWLWEGMEGL